MNNSKRNSCSGKGYYIALILCAAAIGITGYLYHRNESKDVSLQETQAALPAAATQEADVPVLATQPAADPTTAPTTPPTEAREPLKTAAPIPGDAVSGYSMEALSYNQTTRDWRTHNGMDLAAEEGTEVRAAAEGTVYTVYEDDAMGHTVVIRHRDGYTTRYSSLMEEIPVKPGQTVALGEVIGYAGATALVETVMGPHVHFSVTCHDRPMDPAEFLDLG